MKVISIKQPWASLIVYGYKEYEFRSWKTKYRGKLYIHASKSYSKKEMNKFKKYNIPFDTGCIIGSVDLVSCIKLDSLKKQILNTKNSDIYSNDYMDKYAWYLKNPNLEEKVYINGKLGIWNYEKNS